MADSHNYTPAQKFLLFLGDVAWAAFDSQGANASFTVVHRETSRPPADYWLKFIACSPRAQLVLQPTHVPASAPNNASWIDTVSERVTPAALTHLQQIFAAGTNGKFVGLWRRAGSLVIDIDIRFELTASATVIGATVEGLQFNGTGALADWWP